jgi:hypothetical protein
MNVAAAPNWSEANQRYLAASLEHVRRRLEACAHQDATTEAGLDSEAGSGNDAAPTEWQLSAPPALQTICAAFELTPFERDLLLLCAGLELDARFAPLCAALAKDGRGARATFSLALAVLENPHWSAVTPAGPLRHWHLLETDGVQSLTTAALRIDERILHYLTGVSFLDDRLQGLLTPLTSPRVIAPSHAGVGQKLADIWSHRSSGAWVAVQLCGVAADGKIAACAIACAKLGRQLWRLRAADVPHPVAERTALARLCERELLLSHGALLVDCDTAPPDAIERAVVPFVEELAVPVAIASRNPLSALSRTTVRLDVERPQTAEQRALWRAALGPVSEKLNGQLEGLIAQFGFDHAALESAAATADGEDDLEATTRRLWDACRMQARGRLDGLARRVDAVAKWDDLVLPGPQRDLLREIAIHLRRAVTVYETWGFAAKSARGLGISALFAGASGTGKTMAAEVIANELNLDLYRIDLSQVVSKYIGETEKNLGRIFDTAEQSASVLLFDEADALFGQRSEVKDSHDRYANIEVSYLLQRMEDYRGLAILTTNMKSALDQAFLRRIRFVVQFPFPDFAHRTEIWRRVFPVETPTQEIDPALLARLTIAGGNIRNIALAAAFLAAEEGTPVRMGHLRRAAQNEYAKLEKPLTSAELGGWT